MSFFERCSVIENKVYKQWWSRIPPISTKRATTSHLNKTRNHLTPQQNVQPPHTSTKRTTTSHLNKTYNHLTPQQNVQPPHTSTKRTTASHFNKTYNRLTLQFTEYKKIPRYMTLETQGLSWDWHTNVAGLNSLMRSKFSPFDNWISNCNTNIYKWKTKETCRFASTQKDMDNECSWLTDY